MYFLSQQAAEKALKAYLYFIGVEEVWVNFRYPDALPEEAVPSEVYEEDAQSVFKKAKSILSFIKNQGSSFLNLS